MRPRSVTSVARSRASRSRVRRFSCCATRRFSRRSSAAPADVRRSAFERRSLAAARRSTRRRRSRLSTTETTVDRSRCTARARSLCFNPGLASISTSTANSPGVISSGPMDSTKSRKTAICAWRRWKPTRPVRTPWSMPWPALAGLTGLGSHARVSLEPDGGAVAGAPHASAQQLEFKQSAQAAPAATPSPADRPAPGRPSTRSQALPSSGAASRPTPRRERAPAPAPETSLRPTSRR